MIAGLGNVGEEYTNTRHNIGFQVLDSLAAEKNIAFTHERHSFKSTYTFKGRSLHLIKPTTYMNLSGKAIRYWLQKLDIPYENLLVIVDDLALPFGKLRLRSKGGDAGHNGLKDIITILETSGFPRLRFGISSEFQKGRQVNYVLGAWNREEKEALPKHIKTCCDIIHAFVTIGINQTMTQFNKQA